MTSWELFHFVFWFIDSVHSKDGTAFCAGGGFSWLSDNGGSPEPPNGNQNWHLKLLWFSGARFSKVPITYRARKAVLCLHFNIKVSIILKMIPWNYQLTKQNWPVCELGTVLLFNRFWCYQMALGYRAYWGTDPRLISDKL